MSEKWRKTQIKIFLKFDSTAVDGSKSGKETKWPKDETLTIKWLYLLIFQLGIVGVIFLRKCSIRVTILSDELNNFKMNKCKLIFSIELSL